jgi:hypothetical protein
MHAPSGELEVGSEVEEELQDALALRYDQPHKRGRGGSSRCRHCHTAISRDDNGRGDV